MGTTDRANVGWKATGKQIRMLRQLHSMTQQTLASRCYVSQSVVSAWERGTKCPSFGNQHRLADVLRVERAQLFAALEDGIAA